MSSHLARTAITPTATPRATLNVAQALLLKLAQTIGCKSLAANMELVGGKQAMNSVKELWNDEMGASMAEYAMLLALIAVATIGAVTALRDQIVAVFNTSAATLGTAK